MRAQLRGPARAPKERRREEEKQIDVKEIKNHVTM
jgi:hypothetical protein